MWCTVIGHRSLQRETLLQFRSPPIAKPIRQLLLLETFIPVEVVHDCGVERVRLALQPDGVWWNPASPQPLTVSYGDAEAWVCQWASCTMLQGA